MSGAMRRRRPRPMRSIYSLVRSSVWTYDEIAGQYYFHRFYHFEPDLNVMHEGVREEISRVLDYWLSFGISGFRVDAVSHMIESPHKSDSPSGHDPHQATRELRAFTCARRVGCRANRRSGRRGPPVGRLLRRRRPTAHAVQLLPEQLFVSRIGAGTRRSHS
jgi:glycosidase